MTTATKWWRRLNGQVVCDLCPRTCALHEGQRGFCFVRQNVGGRMELTTYGRSTGFCIDPIEKKPLFHFLPGTPVLSFGTAGCNLGCKFCQNWSISKSREIEALSEHADPEAIALAAQRSGCRSVAFTYNDPVIWAEYAIDTARACRAIGIQTVAVTAGYIQPAARPEFFEVMDAANVDLKAFTETFYSHLTLSHIEPVLDTLRWLRHESNVWFEITNLMIPGENDAPEEVARMCDWIVKELGPDVPVHFTAFHPDFRLRDRPNTPPETLFRAHDQARQAGIRFAYVGNVHDTVRQSTYCPRCGTLLIERDWHQLGAYAIRDGGCERCGESIPGVFEGQRGDWGPRRRPVLIDVSNAAELPVAVRPPAPTPPIELTADQESAIRRYAREVLESCVRGTPEQFTLPAELASQPVFGVFVSLHRATLLRGCRGRWGTPAPVEEQLRQATRDCATGDQRFPSIRPEELPMLRLDVSLMHDPRPIMAQGKDRAEQIQVGRDGLVITHTSGRGLLLPQVAAEAGWDAETFLSRLCDKARLPAGAWTWPETRLLAFEARVLRDPPTVEELDARRIAEADLFSLTRFANDCLRRDQASVDELPTVLQEKHVEELGVCLRTARGRTLAATGVRRSLANLVRRAIGTVEPAESGDRVRTMTLLWQPIWLSSEDADERISLLERTAVLARTPDKWGLYIPSGNGKTRTVAEALASVGATSADWKGDPSIRLIAFSSRSVQIRDASHSKARRTRFPARAGQFYPRDSADVARSVDQYLAEGTPGDEPVRGVLLPHAGWMYCGRVIGKTLAGIRVPNLVIVLSPQHTAWGPPLSVSSDDAWEIPTGTIPVDAESRRRLLNLVPSLQCEASAHREEHGVEVLLPFLYRMNPGIAIVPIVLGMRGEETALPLALGLAELLRGRTDPCLIVVSSDLNHFESEERNRTLDHLAIAAFLKGDPHELYSVVRGNQISMCGLLPAVVALAALSQSGSRPHPRLIDYTNSGQVTGELDRVVGYAGLRIP